MDNVNSENLYIIEITETLNRLVVVKANSKEEALRDAGQRYHNGNIVLKETDLVDSSIELYNYADPMDLESVLDRYFEENRLDEEKILRLLEYTEIYRKLSNKTQGGIKI